MRRLFWCVIAFTMAVICFSVHASALNTGFSTEELPENEKERIISHKSITLIDQAPEKMPFECFDVNEDGRIAIGQTTWQSGIKEICVYLPNGDFQYGYRIACNVTFGIEWDGDLINIYYCRDSFLISVDRQGQIVDVVSVPNSEENDAYRRQHLLRKRKMVEDKEYLARNDFSVLYQIIAQACSQLVIIQPSGEEQIFYDVSEAYSRHLRSIVIIIIIFVVLAIIGIIITVAAFNKPMAAIDLRDPK